MSSTNYVVLGRSLIRLLVTVVAIVVAFVCRQVLVHYLDWDLPAFILFYPAVMIVGLFAGFWPGLVATALASALTEYWIYPPVGHLELQRSSDAASLSLFTGMGVFMSLVAERYRGSLRNTEELKQELLLRESVAKLKETEDKLLQASEHRSLAADAAGLGAWEYRLDTGRVHWDERCRNMFGVTTGDEFDYKECINRIHPEDGPAVDRAVTEAIGGANSGAFHREYRVLWPNGSIHWVASHGQVYFEDEGKTLKAKRFVGANMDVTERKEREEALRSSQAKLQSIIGSAMDAVISVDEQQRIVVFNRAAEAVFQCAATQAIGSTLDRFLPSSLREVHREHLRRFGREGVTARSMSSPGILTAVRLNGETFPIEATISQVIADGEKIYTVILRDITARKRTEEELQEKAALLDLAHDTIMVRELDGTIRFWNHGAEEMYGYTPEEAIGRVSHDLLHDVLPQPLEEIEAALQLQGRWEGEVVHSVKDGRCITVASRWALQRRGNDQAPRVMEINNDISVRKHAEQQLQELNQELEERVRVRTSELETVNRELESFSYSVSHDLRAPLRTMDGFSQALLEDQAERLDEKGLHYLERIRMAAQRMGALIDALLQLSRVTRGEVTIESVDLSGMAQSIIDDLRQADPTRSVEVNIEQGLHAMGDSRLLQVALQNLISNAWKFTSRSDHSKIEIGMVKGPSTSYFVRDNGAGFDMQYADQLFGAFQRLHSDEAFRGTGIGLATVQRIIRRHHGRIWAEAAEGKGATFHFELRAA